ncbi:uncharacterized protein [Clytia hemisphaerica]
MDETKKINIESCRSVNKMLFGYKMKTIERMVWSLVLLVVMGTGLTFGFIYYPIHAALVIGSGTLVAVVHKLMFKLFEKSPKKNMYTRRLFYLGGIIRGLLMCALLYLLKEWYSLHVLVVITTWHFTSLFVLLTKDISFDEERELARTKVMPQQAFTMEDDADSIPTISGEHAWREPQEIHFCDGGNGFGLSQDEHGELCKYQS